jgi:thiol-disulfide isomerase/thioredoxin
MGRGGAGLIAAMLALAGCKSTPDTKSPDREPTGTGVARAKGKDGKDAKDSKDTKDGKTPTWLDPVAKLPGGDTGVPKAATSTGDPKNPNFDAKTAAQDAVGGKVVDVFNRPAKDVFIRIAAANDPPGAAALGILTNGDGYFFTTGLKPGVAYNLTAEATQDGKQLTGTVQTRVPNPVLTIILREDNGLPPASPKTPVSGTGGSFPPPPAPTDGDHIPAAGLAPSQPRTNLPKADDAFSPEVGTTRTVPANIGTSSTPVTPKTKPTGSLPDPDDLSLPPGTPVTHPENVAEAPRNPFTPPTASIPGPNLPPSYPVPQPSPGTNTPDPKQSRVRAGANFALIDTLKRHWDFSTDRSGSVVLLEFVTTACPNCKPVVPVMMGFQSKYAADGLQVIAVLCDEVSLEERIEAAKKYGSTNNVNYAIFVEPGSKPGLVRDKLGVDRYPTAVLLDSTGAVLWHDHPGKGKADLEAAIRKALGK